MRTICSKIFLIFMVMALLLNIHNGRSFVFADDADEYDVLRGKWVNIIVGNGTYNTTDPDMIAKVTKMTKDAKWWQSGMNRDPSISKIWTDYEADTSPSFARHLDYYYGVIESMAICYGTVGSSLYHDSNLADDIVRAMDWYYANGYNVNAHNYSMPEWWYFEIRIPLRINNICAILYDQLGTERINNYMNAIKHFTPDPTKNCRGEVSPSTGGNRAWLCDVHGVMGILLKDGNEIAKARDGLSILFDYVTTGDGFYEDGSDVEHSTHPYNGGYGLTLIEQYGLFSTLIQGTSWEVTDPDQSNAINWIYESYEPFMHKGRLMDMINGRAASRDYNADTNTATVIAAVMNCANTVPSVDAINYKSMIKSWITDYPSYNYYKSLNIHSLEQMKAIMDDDNIPLREKLIKNKPYTSMDRILHLRSNYKFGLSMFSNRISNYESINGENLKGWYTGSGMTNLYNSDENQYYNGYLATVDPYRMPGTTVSSYARANSSGASYLNTRTQVGAASLDNMYGTACMYLTDYQSQLQAQKSWFMFDDEIVALGSGIKDPEHSVETIIDNRMLSDTGDNALIVNGEAKSTELGWTEGMTSVNWMHLAGNVAGADVGYYLPGGANVKGLREARNGKWSDINSTCSTTPLTRNFMALWFDHGSNPTAENYAYVMLPGKTADETAGYAANPKVNVLVNNEDVQAVRQNELNITGAVFWKDKPQKADLITSNKKSVVMTKETEKEIEITVSDPTRANVKSIDLDINKAGNAIIEADVGVTVQRLTPTIQLSVNVHNSNGKTFKVKIGLAEPNGSETNPYRMSIKGMSNGLGITTGIGEPIKLVTNDPSVYGNDYSVNYRIVKQNGTSSDIVSVGESTNNINPPLTDTPILIPPKYTSGENLPVGDYDLYIWLQKKESSTEASQPVELKLTVKAQASDGVYISSLSDGNSYIYFGKYKHPKRIGLQEFIYYGVVGPDGIWEADRTPVLWQVMGEEKDETDNGDGKITLMSKYAMGSYQFNSANKNDYTTSIISEALNSHEEFFNGDRDLPGFLYNTFNSSEESAIPLTPVVVAKYYSGTDPNSQPLGFKTEINGDYGIWPKLVNQKVYLPWGTKTGADSDTSVYWSANNVIDKNKIVGNLTDQMVNFKGSTPKRQWLRTPSSGGDTSVMGVYQNNGAVYSQFLNTALSYRPIIKLNLSDIVFASEIKNAPGTNPTYTLATNSNDFAEAPVGKRNFKLTVLGDNGTGVNPYHMSIKGISSDGATIRAKTGGTVQLATNDASASESAYSINYKIVKQNGSSRNILGYGKLASGCINPSGIDTPINIPVKDISGANLSVGDYDLYIWLQKNNADMSNEASQPVYLKLKVQTSVNPADLLQISSANYQKSENEIHYSISVLNQDADKRSGCIVHALYDNSGSSQRLVSCKTVPFSNLNSWSTFESSGIIDISVISGNQYTVKSFLWGDIHQMLPLDIREISNSQL